MGVCGCVWRGCGYECEFVSVGVCGEGLDVGVSAGQVCECGENKTWTWEWCRRGDV